MKKAFIIFLFFLSAAMHLSAQSGSVLYSLSEKNGLSDNSVNCFFQDSRGIMWMGTNYGLNCFDGSVIKNFYADSNAHSLPSDVVNDIKEWNEQLWIATGKGLSSYDFKNKTFTNFSYGNNNEVLNRFYSLAVYKNRLLLATEEGLLIFNLLTHTFECVKNPADKAGNRITQVFVDSRQLIWVATYSGLWLFDAGQKTFKSFETAAGRTTRENLINGMCEDHQGNLWIGTWSHGLKKIVPQKNELIDYLPYKASTTNVLSVAELKSSGNDYALLINTYLLQLDTATHAFKSFLREGTDSELLKSATRVFTDRNNLLWIACEQGVKIYDPARQYFNTIEFSKLVPLSTQGISLLPLNNKVLMGAEGTSALQLFNNSLKLLNNYSTEITEGAAVMNIQKDANDNYWLGTSKGLLLLNRDFKKIKSFTHKETDKKSLPRNFVSNLLIRKNGELWLMLWRRGLWKMNPLTEEFQRVMAINNDTLLPRANIAKVLEDDNGNFWFTDFTDGLLKYTVATGEVKKIISPQRLTNQVLFNKKLWTVSARDIYAVDLLTDKVDTYPLPKGQNKYVHDFMIDSAGVLWIGTKSGLVAFSTSAKQFQVFTSGEGLHNDVVEVTFAQLSNGNILMAGNTYATEFSPTIAFHAKTRPALLFTGATYNGNEKNVDNNEVTYNWNEKNIQLNWALLNYSNPAGNRYYCKLQGADKDWQFVGNRGTIAYNSLEPGQYTFSFRASTSEGLMSEEKNITIVIKPPFWKTWWFITLCLALVSFLFYYVVRYVSQRNLKERVLKLEKEQAIEKERNRISRDMHDELGSGLTKIAILTEVVKTQTSSNENIDKISHTARELVDNLDEMVWALNPRNDTLDQLMAYVAEYTQQYFENTEINCVVDMPLQIAEQHVGEERRRNLFMVLKEFLNNTVKHSGAKNISITLIQREKGFVFTIKDDGRGFNTNLKSGNGNGITNMLQRINDSGGTAQLTSGDRGTELRIEFDT